MHTEGKKKPYDGQVSHVVDGLLSSLLVNEVSESSRDVHVLWSFFIDLFVGEIFTNRKVKRVKNDDRCRAAARRESSYTAGEVSLHWA